MSVESLAVVLHHSKASGTDKLVLIGIANHDGDGGAWPSVGTLAKYANVSPRSVNRSLDKLRELGEVIVYLQAGGTRHTADHKRPNRYEVLVKCPEGCDRTSAHRVKAVDKSEELPLELVDKRKSKPLTHTSPEPSLLTIQGIHPLRLPHQQTRTRAGPVDNRTTTGASTAPPAATAAWTTT